MVGSVIGTLTMTSGNTIYVMEFQHRGQSLFLPIGRHGVALLRPRTPRARR
jgi:hypothetical protein